MEWVAKPTLVINMFSAFINNLSFSLARCCGVLGWGQPAETMQYSARQAENAAPGLEQQPRSRLPAWHPADKLLRLC